MKTYFMKLNRKQNRQKMGLEIDRKYRNFSITRYRNASRV